MSETIGLTTGSGLTFTADVAGPAGGPLVLLLHGFPESRHSWREALPELAKAGYRAVAPDQRGYSPGARPDPADLSNYAFDRLVGDALEIAAAAGYGGKRFHLAGHDWGGQVSWGVANAHPERLASLTVLSRPHPLYFGPIRVPTLYLWGDADATVGPDAARGTGEFVTSAYAMEVLPGVGHFVMDQAAGKATGLMLAHLARHPV
jgi:pimeloyl-ACP methyl ester carboxylesterase